MTRPQDHDSSGGDPWNPPGRLKPVRPGPRGRFLDASPTGEDTDEKTGSPFGPVSLHSPRTTRRHGTAVRFDEGREPVVRHSTTAVIPPSRYEVILVSSSSRWRLRGRHRTSP